MAVMVQGTTHDGGRFNLDGDFEKVSPTTDPMMSDKGHSSFFPKPPNLSSVFWIDPGVMKVHNFPTVHPDLSQL